MRFSRRSVLCILSVSTLLIVSGSRANGQFKEFEEAGSFGPLIGLHTGGGFAVEGGVGVLLSLKEHNEAYYVTSAGASVEVIVGEHPVIAPRLTAWYTHGIFTVGLGGGVYIGEDRSVFTLQPEIGLGFWTNRITWRLNLFLGDEPDGLGNSGFNMTAFIPL